MPQASAIKIIQNDHLSLVMASIGPIAISSAIITFISIFINNKSLIMMILCLIFTVIAVTLFILLGKRITKIKQFINNGVLINATVIFNGSIGDRGLIEFEYSYADQQYTSSTPVLKNKRTEKFIRKESIIVAIDPDNPTHAMAAEPFCQSD